MSYRYQKDAREENGKRSRQIRGMISRRQFHQPGSRQNGQVQLVLGREAGDGSFEQDEVDVCQPVGLVANPHEYSTVESITLFIGADGDHPISGNTIDHRKYEVIEKAGLDADEVIVYTTQSIVKIYRDGHVEIRSLDGTAVPLATKADVDAVNARVAAVEQALNALIVKHNTMVLPVVLVPPTAGPPPLAFQATPSASSATVNGTTVLKAQ